MDRENPTQAQVARGRLNIREVWAPGVGGHAIGGDSAEALAADGGSGVATKPISAEHPTPINVLVSMHEAGRRLAASDFEGAIALYTEVYEAEGAEAARPRAKAGIREALVGRRGRLKQEL